MHMMSYSDSPSRHHGWCRPEFLMHINFFSFFPVVSLLYFLNRQQCWIVFLVCMCPHFESISADFVNFLINVNVLWCMHYSVCLCAVSSLYEIICMWWVNRIPLQDIMDDADPSFWCTCFRSFSIYCFIA